MLDVEVDDIIWKDLLEELVDKCLGYFLVLIIVFKLRELNRIWRGFFGILFFMVLYNYGRNINFCFGFLMYGINILIC